jgi:hypothetical protein
LAKSTGKLFKTPQSTNEYVLYLTGGKIHGIDILPSTILRKSQ